MNEVDQKFYTPATDERPQPKQARPIYQMMCTELKEILRIAAPQMLLMLFQTFAFSGVLAFVGNYDPIPSHIAGASLGLLYSNVTGVSIGTGIVAAVTTFCSRNFGRNAPHENGFAFVQCLKCLVVVFGFALLMALISGRVLGALGQPENVLGPAQRVATVQACGLPFQLTMLLINRVLVTQKVQIQGVFSITSNIVVVLTSWLLLRSGWGFIGVAWAQLIGNSLGCLGSIMFVMLTGRGSTVWRKPKSGNKVTFHVFVKDAIPTALSMVTEWWALEILSILAGLLPNGDTMLATNGIVRSTMGIFCMAFLGIQIAAQNRVGELVGARDTERLRISILTVLTTGLAIAFATSLTIKKFSTSLVQGFTQDTNIVQEADSAILGVVLSIPPYSVMMGMLGVLRSAGMRWFGTSVIFVSFYCCGIPVAGYLGLFRGFGLVGIWLGNALSLTLAASGMLVRVYFLDWKKVTMATLANVQQTDEHITPSDVQDRRMPFVKDQGGLALLVQDRGEQWNSTTSTYSLASPELARNARIEVTSVTQSTNSLTSPEFVGNVEMRDAEATHPLGEVA